MAIVRILVDGYSLLHNWLELARGHARFSAPARTELIHRLAQYRDAAGTPITIVFDGGQPPPGAPAEPVPAGVEVICSKAGQTADQIIERVVELMRPYGEVLVITDDLAERETVISLGGMATRCEVFIRDVNGALDELQRDVQLANRRESLQFKRPVHRILGGL